LTISGAQVAICGCRDTGKPGVCKGYKKGQAQTPPPGKPTPPGLPPGYPPVLNQHVAKKTAAATPPGKRVKIPPRKTRSSAGSGVKAPKVKLPKPTQPSKLAQSIEAGIVCGDWPLRDPKFAFGAVTGRFGKLIIPQEMSFDANSRAEWKL